ncbi:Enamine/imine deaminase [Aedoeadaptatus ivorii]|uniref:Enamine/imine deaminase n=1 Tax=Aedoeadaptatus ivorii TaxID=54006 RepID=A0A3S4Z3L3_9FIRM|nr:RidA family protein [Peptoniphilus ivorii]MDQ0507678.1 2-iminobutanoate/2-iminopropanoate deaminase [Peptoniphilus ivorii]VEJ35393.1 Enamine/imine deaminase [Peptoniphilus ivorii]
MNITQTDKAPAAIGPYSQAVVSDSVVYTSGQIPVDPATGELKTDIKEATHQSLTNLKNLLEASGSSLENTLKVNIFITDMDQFGAINEVYAEYFSTHKPARSCVAVKTLPKNAVIEIEAIARTK